MRHIPIGGHSPSQMHGLRTKLVELGQLYSRSERYFPLAYLVQLLEQTSCKQGWEAGFVHQTLLEVGVSITALFNTYDHLFKTKVSACLSLPLSVSVCILKCVDSCVSLCFCCKGLILADSGQAPPPPERPSLSTLYLCR